MSEAYPGLSMQENNSKPIFAGIIGLYGEDGLKCDEYHISIHPTEEYPHRYPLVFETGGRIPKNIDWHVFESDGHLCIETLPEELIACSESITLEWFIDAKVKPYLFNQTYRRLNGFFLNERKHGYSGEFETYVELFGTRDLFKIGKYLHIISQRKEPNRVSKCFCGGNDKYRKCHRDAYRKFSGLSDEQLKILISRVAKVYLQQGNTFIS